MNKSIVSLAVTAVITMTPAVHAAADNSTLIVNEVIVVSGKKPDQTLNELAGSIAVTTAQEIERHLVTDMNKLFKYDPSIVVTGGSGTAQNFVIRGMGGDRVLMIKDGMRMNEGYGANGANDIVGRGFIDVDTLKQVEVAKGAASSLYGADALGGIVVFTTKDPQDYLANDDFYTSIKTGYSSESSQGNIGTTLAFNTGEFGHVLNITRRDGHEQKNYFDSKTPLALDSTSIFYKTVYHFSPQQQLKFSADLWQQNAHSDVASTLAKYFRGLADYGYIITAENRTGEQENNSYKLSFHDQVSRSWSDQFNIALYSNKTRQQDVEFVNLDINAPMFGVVGVRDMWANYDYQQQTIGLISNGVKKFTLDDIGHTVGFGLDIERTNSIRTMHEYRVQNGQVIKDTTSDKYPENDILRAGLFINDTIEINDKVQLIGGLRWDQYTMDPQKGTKSDGYQYQEINEQQLSPNLAIIVDLSKNVSTYAQFAKGFKVPAYDLAYLDHDNSRYGYKIIPTDKLDPERSDSFEVGLRGNAGDFSFSSAIFYNEYNDFINIALIRQEDSNGDGTNDIDVFQYDNLDKVVIKGAELNLTYYINDATNVFINTAYQDGKDKVSGDYLRDISPLSGTVGMAYQQDNWGGDLLVSWAKKMTKVNKDQVEPAGYAVVDLTAYAALGENFKINIGLFNILDKKYTNYSAVAGTHKTDFSADDANYRLAAGREYSISLKYVF